MVGASVLRFLSICDIRATGVSSKCNCLRTPPDTCPIHDKVHEIAGLHRSETVHLRRNCRSRWDMDSNCLDSDVQRSRVARSHSAANDQTLKLVEWLAQRAGTSHESSPVAVRTMRAAMRLLSNPSIDIGELAGAE